MKSAVSILLVLALAALDGCGGREEPTGASGGSNGLPKTITIGAPIAKSGWLAPYDGTSHNSQTRINDPAIDPVLLAPEDLPRHRKRVLAGI